MFGIFLSFVAVFRRFREKSTSALQFNSFQSYLSKATRECLKSTLYFFFVIYVFNYPKFGSWNFNNNFGRNWWNFGNDFQTNIWINILTILPSNNQFIFLSKHYHRRYKENITRGVDLGGSAIIYIVNSPAIYPQLETIVCNVIFPRRWEMFRPDFFVGLPRDLAPARCVEKDPPGLLVIISLFSLI